MTESEKILEKIKQSRSGITAGREDIPYTEPKSGITTGMFDLDYRIGGWHDGWYIVFTGETGHGKTTATREFVLAAAASQKKVFYFVGEEGLEVETRNLARVGAKKEELIIKFLLAGRAVAYANEARYSYFKEWSKGKIIMESAYDIKHEKPKVPMERIVIDTDMLAAYNMGARFFVLDNMAKLTEGAPDIFKAQRRIVEKIQMFVRKYNVPVLLVTHPNEAGKVVGGVGEITNHADCVLRIKRFVDGDKDKASFRGIPDYIATLTSGMIYILKAREEGLLGRVPLTWDSDRGRLSNITDKSGSGEYEDAGWWTRSVTPF